MPLLKNSVYRHVVMDGLDCHQLCPHRMAVCIPLNHYVQVVDDCHHLKTGGCSSVM